jgi:hypothetical protein
MQYIELPPKAREIIRSWLDIRSQDVLSTTCWVEDPVSMALLLDLTLEPWDGSCYLEDLYFSTGTIG